jgi:hypothetical protein
MFTDSFFSPSSWFTTFSARIELSIEEHSEYMKNRLNGIRPSEESLRLQFPLGGLTSFTPTPAILLFSGWENSGQTKIRTTH